MNKLKTIRNPRQDLNSHESRRKSKPQAWLQIAQLRAEKCDLKEARAAYFLALQEAKKEENLKHTMEAIAGLLRLAGEALDEESILKWNDELNQLMEKYPRQVPAMAYYCQGAVARHQKKLMLAQLCFHRYLNAVKRESHSEEAIATKP
jgi:DnaJ-domain-containing protein 1